MQCCCGRQQPQRADRAVCSMNHIRWVRFVLWNIRISRAYTVRVRDLLYWRSRKETLYRDLSRRSCQEVFSRDLAKISFREPQRDLTLRSLAPILCGNLLRGPCTEILLTDRLQRAYTEILFRDLLEPSCQETSHRDPRQRSCIDNSYSDLAKRYCRVLVQRSCPNTSCRDLVCFQGVSYRDLSLGSFLRTKCHSGLRVENHENQWK